MDLDLKNKHVLICGGSSGLGFACAMAYLREQATVTVVSRDESELDECKMLLTESVPQAQNKIHVFHADLSDIQATSDLIAQIEHTVAPIDILVNSLGAGKKDATTGFTAADFMESMNGKYGTYMNVISCVVVGMQTRRHGSIVNIAGAGGKISKTDSIARGAASSAVMLASVGLAKTYAPYGVRINVVNPNRYVCGNHRRDLPLRQRLSLVTLEQATLMDSTLPIGRVALASEVADAVLFLSSPRASYISGTVLTVDAAASGVI